MSVIQTAQQVEILLFIATNKTVPVDVIARRFFRTNKQTGQPNKDPYRACLAYLRNLADKGLLNPIVRRGTRTLDITSVTVTQKAATALGVEMPRSTPQNGKVHHAATLALIEDLRDSYAPHGISIAEARLEFRLRAEEQAGKATQKGQSYESFPDAVLVLAKNGAAPGDTEEVALEYVSSKYSDKDILEKAESFRRFDNVIWAAENATTAKRVEVLTGRPVLVRSRRSVG